MTNPEDVLELFSKFMPREKVLELIERSAHQLEAYRKIEEYRASQLKPWRDKCIATFRERFGDRPESLSSDLYVMEPAMLRAADDLIRISADEQAFFNSFALLFYACGEGKTLGARQALRGLVAAKFGNMSAVHRAAIDAANDSFLNICFERLLEKDSAEEVLAPLLRHLGIREPRRPQE